VTDLRLPGVFTSTIGSFPLDDSAENRRICLEDLLALGIDFPAYPQLGDMGEQFLKDLAQQKSGIVAVNGRFRLKKKSIRHEGLPPGLEPFYWTIGRLEERGIKQKAWLKAAVTGPFTLASYIETGTGAFPFNTAASSPSLVKQLAQVISKSCQEVSKEASMVSIDEPILSVMVGVKTAFGYLDEDIINIYDGLKKYCGNKIVGTHICGKISPKLASILLRTNLDFISHEFYDTPENAKTYDSAVFQKADKMLSVGCLSTRKPKIETTREILSLMRRFSEYKDSLIFTPDCGFRKLLVHGVPLEEAYKISVTKLKNMVEAAKMFQASY
jgi:methionine synthase II (cobalamin-independent)